jgi:hypothetical protein
MPGCGPCGEPLRRVADDCCCCQAKSSILKDLLRDQEGSTDIFTVLFKNGDSATYHDVQDFDCSWVSAYEGTEGSIPAIFSICDVTSIVA